MAHDMRRRVCGWGLTVAALVGLAGCGAAREETVGPWDVAALAKAPACEWIAREGKVRSLFYEGEPWQGRKTRVYALYASPVTFGEAEAGKRYPAVVLVHGGGGHAFAKWVELWAKRGYAAIAMDLGGEMGDGKDVKRLPDGGPKADDQTRFRHPEWPERDQWSYHAVADVVLAHSLVRSFPEVDAEKTAVLGISWGGYLTCIVAGVDQRLKAAVPLYGCGFLQENSAWSGGFKAMGEEWAAKWTATWDPKVYVGRAKMPVFFVNGSNDAFYFLDSYAKTYALVNGEKNIRIEPKMPHGHIFDTREILLFVDQHLKGGEPLPKVTGVEVKEGQVTVTVAGPTKTVRGQMHYTFGPHRENKTRAWESKGMAVEGTRVTGPAPPAGATAWYVTVTDETGVMVSSEVRITGQQRE